MRARALRQPDTQVGTQGRWQQEHQMRARERRQQVTQMKARNGDSLIPKWGSWEDGSRSPDGDAGKTTAGASDEGL